MSKLVWDQTGERLYETGTEHGVLYLYNNNIPDFSESSTYEAGDVVIHSGKVYKAKEAISTAGAWSENKWNLVSRYCDAFPWNGLTAVTESPSGAEETALYADNIKYLSLRSAEQFGATVEAYTYPDEFEACDGTASLYAGVTIGQQSRKMFGLAFKTLVGNDVDGNDFGYKLHLIYGATAAPTERPYATVNESPEAITFSWELTTTPTEVVSSASGAPTFKPTASVIIDSTKLTSEANKTKLKSLEDKLFGTDSTDPFLPLPGDIYDLFNAAG